MTRNTATHAAALAALDAIEDTAAELQLRLAINRGEIGPVLLADVYTNARACGERLRRVLARLPDTDSAQNN
jgi:hypothetical protein